MKHPHDLVWHILGAGGNQFSMLAEETRLASIIRLFDDLFFGRFNTRLLGGAAEPIYIPAGIAADESELDPLCAFHRLYFRHDYLSSALHEAAHWCIAGDQRRAQMDFGYWYHPDGRSPQQQQLFELAEIKPQALEWMFSVACRQPFLISTDNLASGLGSSPEFANRVVEQLQHWCSGDGLPSRGQQFIEVLASRFGCSDVFCQDHYQLDKLR